MVTRKRVREEVDEEDEAPTAPPSLLQRIRNMWEFASFMQYLFLFGKAIKVEDFEIEQFEEELLKVEHSQKLSEIALTLLKTFSSFRPLNLDTYEEDMRRRYARNPAKQNPFGEEDDLRKFADLDVFTKIRVLHQLSVWTFNNPDKLRERMAEKESEQTNWRMEPLGWDDDERAYFVFDDDRLYRRTDAPLPPEPEPKSKAKGKNAKKTRSAKRRRISRPVIESSPDEEEEGGAENGEATNGVKDEHEEDDGLGGMKWELVAITLDEYTSFISTIKRSRDANTKVLYKSLVEHVLPIIEKRAEQLRLKEQRRMKELENLQKLATAKRSSRLANKAEQRKEAEEAEIAERKRQDDLAMAHKEQERQRKLEEARESRMMTREQRLKDREVKRILHEEELKRLEEEKTKAETNESRISERHLKAEMERAQRELEKMDQEEDWTFDCAKCGMHGQNLDDGSHSIACDKCGVWQHSACHGIKQAEAERDDFNFVCTPCKRKAEREAELARQPKIPPLKIRFSASPQMEQKQIQAAPKRSPPQAVKPPVGKFNGVHVPSGPPIKGSAEEPASPGILYTTFAQAPLATAPYRNYDNKNSQTHAQAPLATDGRRRYDGALLQKTAPAPRATDPHYNTTPAHLREAPSPAATATFRSSLQRHDPSHSPPQPSNQASSQSWNHPYPGPSPNGTYSAHSPPASLPQSSRSPPMGTFNTYRPPSQGTPYQHSSPLPRPSLPSMQGAGHASPPSLAKPPSTNLPPLLNGHAPVAHAPTAFKPSAPASNMPGNSQSPPYIPREPLLQPSPSMRFGQFSPFSAHPQGHLSTPQYVAPRPPSAGSPQPLGISPVKHESPRPSPGQAPATSPLVVPPSAALSPPKEPTVQMEPPMKKPSFGSDAGLQQGIGGEARQ